MKENQFFVSKGFIIKTSITKGLTVIFASLLIAGTISFIIGLATELPKNKDVFLFSHTYILFTIAIALIATLSVVLYHRKWCKGFIFTVGDDSVNVKGGIFRRADISLTYEKITDVSIIQNIFERMFKYSIVGLQTAGSPFPEIVFFGVENAEDIKNQIMSKIKENRENNKQ